MKILALMGKAGSGKDTILTALLNNWPERFKKKVSYTTRPPREGEQNDVDYHFVSKEWFENHLDDMIEYCQFRGWYYGTAKEELNDDKIIVGIFTPSGIRQLMEHPDIDLTIFYLWAPGDQRLLRQLKREIHPDTQEIIRRYYADKDDFYDIDDIPYFALDNTDGTMPEFIAIQIMDRLDTIN